METTSQGYPLPRPQTKARLYQDDHLTPLPQRGWVMVALYVDGGLVMWPPFWHRLSLAPIGMTNWA